MRCVASVMLLRVLSFSVRNPELPIPSSRALRRQSFVMKVVFE